MKLIDFIREGDRKVTTPRDEKHYRELKKNIQDIHNDPKQQDPATKDEVKRRSAELDNWAKKNLKNETAEPAKCTHCDGTGKHGDKDCEVCGGRGYVTEDGVQPTDMKRLGAIGKTMYVHKNGKTIMIPAEREKDFIAKGFKRSALRTEDTNESQMRMDKTAFVQMLANKIKEPQKGYGRKEYDNRLLAKMYELITGQDVDFEGNKFTINVTKPQTEDADIDAQFKSDVLQFLNLKVAGIERQLQMAPAKTQEEKENKEFALKLFDFVQKKLEQKDDGNNTLTVPKSMIKKEDTVNEGASMIPYYKTEKDWDGEKRVVWEFPKTWAKDKELDTPYMSNASMRQFLQALGYPADFEDMSAVPIDEFIGVSTQWLKKNIGKQSPEEEPTVDKNPGGPTMISGGRPEGYMNRQVKLHNELARKIKAKYPEVTHVGFN